MTDPELFHGGFIKNNQQSFIVHYCMNNEVPFEFVGEMRSTRLNQSE